MNSTISQKDYWDEVTAIAKSALEENGTDLHAAIWEACDSHQFVIYTTYHHQVLRYTDTDVADRFADMGGPDLTKGWDHVVMQATFLALEGDVSERAVRLQRDGE